MPKVSMAPKDASEAAFGIQAGDVRVVDAEFRVYELNANKKTGETYAPFPALVLTLQQMVDGKKEGDPIEEHWGCGSLAKFEPSDDGEEPNGSKVGTAGRYLCAVKEGVTVDKRSNLFRLNESIQISGWKPELFEESDSQMYVGMEGHVVMKKYPTGRGETNVLIFDRITERSYEKAGKGKKKAKEEEEEAPKGKKKREEEEAKGTEDNGAGEKLTAVLTKIIGKLRDKEETTTKTNLRKSVFARVVTEPPKVSKAVMELFDDDDTLEALAENVGFEIGKKGEIAPTEPED